MDKDKIQVVIADYWKAKDALEPVNKLAIDIALKIKAFRGYSKYENNAENLVVGRDTITYNWEEYTCGETDSYELEFPTSYLWTENWQELELKKIEEEKQARIEEGKKKEAVKKEKDRLLKIDLYHRLQLELGIKEETNVL
jgi:hypothetical protein